MESDTAPAAAGPSGDGWTGDRRGRCAVPPPRSAPDAEAVASADLDTDAAAAVLETDAAAADLETDAAAAVLETDAASADLETDAASADLETDAAASDDVASPAAGTPTTGLTGRERDILDFEQQWWRYPGAKEQAIRDRFGLTATRYYRLLNTLLDNPAALAAEPLLVGRLRRLRSARARDRRR
ncbi:DUF3263 domain-containing protein [Salinispora arenicola]|uniref:DUF3263 domain-containing protein n=1 Tax=Salinispora arenicola TaxID=168697 RepID=UPI000363D177|nr:DUF3263 domain-containing protein [Salinispora arenicola]